MALSSHVSKISKDRDPAIGTTFLFHSFAYICILIVNILIFTLHISEQMCSTLQAQQGYSNVAVSRAVL